MFCYEFIFCVVYSPITRKRFKYSLRGIFYEHYIWAKILLLLLTLIHHLEYWEKYAKPEDIGAVPEEKSSDKELSEEYDSSHDAVAGQPDP